MSTYSRSCIIRTAVLFGSFEVALASTSFDTQLMAQAPVGRDRVDQRAVRPVRMDLIDDLAKRPKVLNEETLKGRLSSTIQDINRVCQLTDQQMQKLEMVGERDQAEWMKHKSAPDQVNGIRVLRVVRYDEEQINASNKMRLAGLTADSFFVKSIPSILTDPQIVRLKEFRRTQLSKCTAAAIKDLRKFGSISDEQAEQLEQILIDSNLNTFPFGKDVIEPSLAERNLMLYQLSLVAEEKVKPILTAEQWIHLEPRLVKFRSFEKPLKDRNLIPSDAETPESANE